MEFTAHANLYIVRPDTVTPGQINTAVGGMGGSRLGRGSFWLSTFLAVAAIALVAANGYMSWENRSLRSEVRSRQNFINQTVRLSRVNSQLIRALAVTAVRNKDTDIQNLLAANGVSISVRAKKSGQGRPPAPGDAGNSGSKR